jgi:hypothetical protein
MTQRANRNDTQGRRGWLIVGLWPPTFQALKAVADTNEENRK